MCGGGRQTIYPQLSGELVRRGLANCTAQVVFPPLPLLPPLPLPQTTDNTPTTQELANLAWALTSGGAAGAAGGGRSDASAAAHPYGEGLLPPQNRSLRVYGPGFRV